jgi:hypothetical protein
MKCREQTLYYIPMIELLHKCNTKITQYKICQCRHYRAAAASSLAIAFFFFLRNVVALGASKKCNNRSIATNPKTSQCKMKTDKPVVITKEVGRTEVVNANAFLAWEIEIVESSVRTSDTENDAVIILSKRGRSPKESCFRIVVTTARKKNPAERTIIHGKKMFFCI